MHRIISVALAVLVVATAAPSGAQPVVSRVTPPADTIERLVIRRWLRTSRFASLDSLLSAYTDSMRRDITFEWQLTRALAAFDIADPTMGPPLDRWVASSPNAHARIARAIFRTELGWNARGTEFRQDTPESRFATTREHFARAADDLSAASQLDSSSFLPYWVALSIAQGVGTAEDRSRYLQLGLARAPASFVMRTRYIEILRPRWYGTHAAMAAFAEQAQGYAGRNPPLRWLRGYVAWDTAGTLKEAKDFEGALRHYGHAIAAGDFALFRLDRAKLHYKMDRYDQALIDLNRAAAQWPQSAEVRSWRGSVYVMLARTAPAAHARDLRERAERDLQLGRGPGPHRHRERERRAGCSETPSTALAA